MKLLLRILMVFTALQPLTACSEFGLSERDKDKPENNLQTETANNSSQNPLNEEAVAVNPEFLGYQLVEFDSCAKTEAHLKDMAFSQLELEKSWEIDHTTRLHNGEDDYIFETDDMVMNEAARTNSEMGSAESAAGDQAGPDNHTETNNQVKGVGEADFIKNTGTHMFQIEGNKVHITKTWPADSMSVEASIKLKNQPYKLLLNENRLIVLSHPVYDIKYYDDLLETQEDEILVESMSDMAIEEPFDPVTGRKYINYDRQRTAVTVYDISTISSPQQVYSYDVAGQVREARRVGSLVRLVSSTHGYNTMPQMSWLKWETKKDKLISLGTKLAAIESYYKLNKEKIEKMTLSNFIRARQLSRVSGNPAPEQISDEMCKKIFSVNAKVNNGVTNVVNIDADTGAMDESLLLAAVNTTYMNEQSLYLVTPYYTRWHIKPGKNTSFVHKFDLKAGVKAAYQGSGEVDGNPLNQFALDEHNNILRIATTVTDWNDRDEIIGFGRANTYNIISTLETTPEGLNVLGKTENLAETERIYSVRYHGDWAYVVTFRQVDPLFTIDLKDPAAPVKVGELKIPGYSSYMQMLDENHILAVGRDGTDTGRILGMKVSIFNVTDKANPTEAATYALTDEMWSSSEAEWDHKAITFDPVTKTLALPISRRYRNIIEPILIDDTVMDEKIAARFTSALYMFTIANDSITEKGVLTAQHSNYKPQNPWWYYGANTIKRSVIADNFVYAISNAGIISADMNDLAKPLQVLTFASE